MNNRYGTLASWVYDLDKPIGRSFGDIEFYLQRLQNCKGPILEPAVGNGRILIPLLEAGLHVEGFDTSREMLSRCQRQCETRGLDTRLRLQRFEDFTYEEKFEAIVIPLGSFQLITDLASAKAVLRRFYDHLVPNGRLIVDLDSIGCFFGPDNRIRSWRTKEGDLLTLTADRVETNFIAQTTASHLRYEQWRDCNLIQVELELFSLRWWGVGEFDLLLREIGFEEIVISGNYRYGQAPQKDDEMISFEARRPLQKSL